MMELNDAFEVAVESRGTGYSEAEEVLVAAGEEARFVLEMNLHREDPVARLIAQMLLARLDGDEDAFISAEGTLDVSERLTAGSAIVTPSPLAVAEGLYSEYEGQSALRASLLLVKREDQAPWKTGTLLAYLEMCRDPFTTGALLRFAVETPDDELRDKAIEVVRKIDDPDLAVRVSYERRRARSRDLPFPAAVAALSPKSEGTDDSGGIDN